MIALTPLQANLLGYIDGYIADSGIAPSFAEMQNAMGAASKSTVHRLLAALVERGRIRRLPNRARAIEVLPHNSLASVSTSDLLAELERRRPGMAALALAA